MTTNNLSNEENRGDGPTGIAAAIGYFFWLGLLMAVASALLAIDAAMYDVFKGINPTGVGVSRDQWHANGQPIILVVLAAVGLVNCVLLMRASSSLAEQKPVNEKTMVRVSGVFALIGIIWTVLQLLVNLARIH